MPSFAEIRDAFPGARDLSDEEILKRISDSTQLPLHQVANDFGYDAGSGGKNAKRLSASVDRYQAGLYGTGEALAGAVGLDRASQYLSQQRQRNEIEADVASGRAQELGAVDAWKDVHNASDFGDYAVGLGIQSLPYIGEAMVGGFAGRLIAGGARAALIGAAGASYPSSVGDILQNQREQSGGQTDLLSAAALGVPYAAANVIGVEGALARGQLFRNGIRALDDVSGIKGGLLRAGSSAARTALEEGGSETFQEFMNQAGRMAVDPSETFFNPQSNERFLESGIGGAVLGGISGGAGGGWRRSTTTNIPINVLPDAQPATETTYAPPDSLTNTPLTDVPGFANRPQDPLQGVIAPPVGPSVNINPNAAAAPAASGNVAANPPSNAPATSGAKQPTEEPVTPEERQATNEKYRTETVLDDGTEEGHWRVFGKDFFKRSDLNKALDKQAVEERGRDEGLSQFEKDLNSAGPAFLRPAKLQELAGQLYASTPEKTAYNLNAAIEGGHKESDRLAAVYEKITGKESPAWKKQQEPAPAKEKAQKVAEKQKPQPAQVATQPAAFAPDDADGMTRAILHSLYNGNQKNVDIAMDDIAGEKVAAITEKYGVDDSQVRKLRQRRAPKAMEYAMKKAGVDPEAYKAALEARRSSAAETVDTVDETNVDERPMDSDERTLALKTDEELTQEQQQSDAYATAGMSVREGSATQVADASTRNNSRAKLEAAKGNVASKSLTPADLNNLWIEAVEKDDRKMANDIERELLLRHKRGELSQADMEALGEAQHESTVPAAEEGPADAAQAAAVPAAPRQANAKKVAKGPVGTAWDKVVRQVAKAKVVVPAWDSLTPEQKTKAQDKYALNGKISMHEVQDVVGQQPAAAAPAQPAPLPQMDKKSAETLAKVRRSTAPSTKEKTGADYMARLNEAAAAKKNGPIVDKMVDDSFNERRQKQLVDEENRETRERYHQQRHQELQDYIDFARTEFKPWMERNSTLANKLLAIEEKIGEFPGAHTSSPSSAVAHIRNAIKYVQELAQERDRVEAGGEFAKPFAPGFFSGVNLKDWMKTYAPEVEKSMRAYMEELQAYLAANRYNKYGRELKKQLDPILNNVVRAKFGESVEKAMGSGAPKGWGRIEGDLEQKSEENVPQRPYAETEVLKLDNGKTLVYSHVVDPATFFRSHQAPRAALGLLELEDLTHILDGIDGLAIAEAPRTRHNSLASYLRYEDGTRGLEISAPMLDGDNGAFTILHELGHAADLASVLGDKTGTFSSDVGLGVLPNGQTNMPAGAYATELFKLYETNDNWKFLRYPFNRFAYPGMNMNTIRKELFAQVFAAYLINPDLVHKDAPLTAGFMEKALEQIRQTDYRAELAKAKAGAARYRDQQRSSGHVDRSGAAVERIEEAEGTPSPVPGRAEAGRSRSAQASRQAERYIEALPQASRTSARRLWTTISDAAKKGFYGAAFTWDLADIAARQLPSVTKYMGLMGKKAAVKTHLEDQVEKILSQSEKVAKTDRLGRPQTGTGEHSINKFLYDSTISGKWGYKEDPASNIQLDPIMQERFNNFSDDAQAMIKAVFRHGADTLRMKQRIIKDEINNEFRQLAKEAGNEPAKVEELERKRRAALQHYDSILFLTANKPYAPLRRFGNYVVVARSQAFRDAVANNNTKAIERMQSDENHYFVAFYETLGEADEHANRLRATGNYAEASAFEKEKGLDAIHNGRDMMTAFQRLRNLIKAELEVDPNDQVARSLNTMISDLYLQTLAETSARKAEIKRRNVAGADLDMMRAFATQGRADAHFVAALKHNGDVTDSIYEMRREAHEGGDDKAQRMRLFNEFMARHALNMEYRETRVQDAILRGTSLWMLATSPAYYLQNATQTPMISIPYMAGKHGYGRSWAATAQAYKDLGPLSQGLNWSDRMDLSKAPADVRRMLQDLVAAGRIDIALDQDLGRFQSRADNALGHAWNTVDRKLRGMAQRVEAINRVTTAIAAYRMELARNGGNHVAATEYASKVIRVTHGDYSAFNTPRYFTPGGGLPAAKVITQFRKFQIIQASLILRLFNNAFTGNVSPEERAIARKALFFMLGHTAAIGGMYGLPGATTLAWLVSKMLGDPDEPDDDELKLRRMIGNEDMADLVLKGAPAYFGVDLSGKLGMGNAFGILPYTKLDGQKTQDDYKNALLGLSGPFLGGILPRFADGADMIGRGNWYKGLEQMVPNGFANAMKAYRFQDEGVTRKSGDVMMEPDEVSFATTVMQAMGLQTKQLTDRTFDQKVVSEFEQFYKDKTSRLTEKYARASKKGDSEEMAKVREQWMELQDARMRNGFPRQPLSTLLKAPVAQARRERQVVNHTGASRNTRQLAEELDDI